MLLLFLFFVLISSIQAEVSIVFFKDIDFNQLELFKTKSIYREKKVTVNSYSGPPGCYTKIWDPTYSRAEYFYNAYLKGFFELTAPTVLKSIIMDGKNRCRGYIARRGMVYENHWPIKTKRIKNSEPFLDIAHQTDSAFKLFYQTILKATRQTNYVYIDFTPFNMVYLDEKYQLIDFDEIMPLKLVDNFFFNDICSPECYRKEILKLKKTT